MVTLVICLSISCAIILLKEKSNYSDNHLLMTYLVILLCERLWVRRKIEIINHNM